MYQTCMRVNQCKHNISLSVTQDKPGEFELEIVDCTHSLSSLVTDQSK